MIKSNSDNERAIENYILRHLDAEPALLKELSREVNLSFVHPRMMSGHLQGRLLKMLVQMIRPRKVLELGTYTAYATLSMCEGLPEGSTITTIEVFDELENFIRQALAKAGVEEKVELIIGDALELLPQMELKEVDLVYLDANKKAYPDYIRLLEERLPIGSFIFADNTLWGGKVIDESAHDPQTVAIRQFNDYIAKSERLETVIIPLRDGLTMIRKCK